MGKRLRTSLSTTAILTCAALASLAPGAGAAPRGAHAGTRHRLRVAGCSPRARRHGHVRHRACNASQRHRTGVHDLSRGPRKHARRLALTPLADTQAQARAATVAAILATPCQNTQLAPDAANAELVRGAVLCLVNQERAQHGVLPLKLSAQLDAAAESHCSELVAQDYFAHVSPSGETPVDRARASGYIPAPGSGYEIGENLAWGTFSLATPQAIVAAWIASPGHLANILESHYLDTGIGLTPAVPNSLAPGAQGATYAQEFGVITG